MRTASAGLVFDVVNDGFARQVFRQRLALRLVARIGNRFLLQLWGSSAVSVDLFAFVEQPQLIGTGFAAATELALLRQPELFEDLLVLLRQMTDLGIFLGQLRLQIHYHAL